MKSFGQFLVLLAGVFLLSAPPAWAVRTVVIDAGHGGHDRGGGPGQRIPEKPYTLDVGLRLQARLREARFRTGVTRSDDYFVGLARRGARANTQRGTGF